MRRKVVRTDRLVLLVLGLVLTAAGVVGLLAGFRAFGGRVADRHLLDQRALDLVGQQPDLWLTGTVVVCLVVLLLCVRLLLAQPVRDTVDVLRSGTGRSRTLVELPAVQRRLVELVDAVHGVRSTRATVHEPTRRRLGYRVALQVVLTADADPATVRQRVLEEVVPSLRRTLDDRALDVVLRLRPT